MQKLDAYISLINNFERSDEIKQNYFLPFRFWLELISVTLLVMLWNKRIYLLRKLLIAKLRMAYRP